MAQARTILLVVSISMVFSLSFFLINFGNSSTMPGNLVKLQQMKVIDESDTKSDKLILLKDFPPHGDPLWIRDQVISYLNGDRGAEFLSSVELCIYRVEETEFSSAEFKKGNIVFRRFKVFSDGKVVEDDIANSLILKRDLEKVAVTLYDEIYRNGYDKKDFVKLKEEFANMLESEKLKILQAYNYEYRRLVEEFNAKKGEGTIVGASSR